MNQLLPSPNGNFAIADRPIFPLNYSADNSLLLSLILPTYQEKDNIQKIIIILANLLDDVIAGKYELIVVDDNSPDRTWEVASKMTREYPQLQVMRRIEEKGLSTAVIRG